MFKQYPHVIAAPIVRLLRTWFWHVLQAWALQFLHRLVVLSAQVPHMPSPLLAGGSTCLACLLMVAAALHVHRSTSWCLLSRSFAALVFPCCIRAADLSTALLCAVRNFEKKILFSLVPVMAQWTRLRICPCDIPMIWSMLRLLATVACTLCGVMLVILGLRWCNC